MRPWDTYRRTNHVLLGIVSVLSGGLMIPVWIIVTINNNKYNKRLYEMRGYARNYA